jgi:D-sedoheptulose 7-phosphate isomerase
MKDNNINSIIGEAFRRHIKVTEESLALLLSEAQSVADMFLEVIRNNGKILVCGNGGSAADSQHFATEWVCKYKDDRRPLAAIALTVDTSAITAIGNDYGFDYIFSRQIEALGNVGDVLVAITTSGKSKNILEAIQAAKRKGIKVILLTGKSGGDLKNVVDVAIVVPSDETARIQEMHELVYHAWCEYVDSNLE